MSEAITKAAAYDLIDRFLRNNLYDDDYAEYSKALEAISQPAPAPQPAAPVVSDEQIKETIDCIDWSQMVTADDYMYMIARAILALRPAGTLTGCNCRWDGETQIEWCELHLAHKDAIHDWAERAKSAEQKLAMRPAVEPMTPEQRKIDQAVHEAVSAIYFADGADYLRALWSVVRGLSPDLARVLELDGEIAWNISEQITTAIGITAKAEGGA